MDSKEYNKMSDSAKKQEDWMNAKWRPMMGWTYMATCLFDFILGPILYNILQYWNPGQAVGMWTPLTLQGGGLYHISMGAIIGVSAYGRTQEKLNGANNGGLPTATPVAVQQPVMMAQPAMATPAPMTAASAPMGGSEYRVETPAPSSDVTMKAGKKAPQQPDFPEI
jgi:hypothetical protein